MKKKIYTTYAPDTDITFIMVDEFDKDGDCISIEVVGWYFGRPDDKDTEKFTGKLKATF